MLIDNKIPFEEVRIKSEDEWKGIKDSFVFGQLPCLKDDDVKIVQSGAIMRHLARRHDLYGRTEMDRTFADMFYEGIRDIQQRYIRMIYNEYEKKNEFIVDYLHDALNKLDALLESHEEGNGFILGENICFADYSLFELLDVLLILSPTCLLQCPKLKSFHQRFNERPSLQNYLMKRASANVRVNWNGKE
ncbi:unnamed protein product [Toxocara canis]|uniref:Glutathione S-transferase n=1 Tax=Toxocara canis TaxID=6265 RepID=A0A3P7GYV5_TOXCA|nr:unnamed protein product [Toxocara canis]